MFIVMIVAFRQPFLHCNAFERELNLDFRNWRARGDNFESELIFAVYCFMMLSAGCAFNLGHEFRKNWLNNESLVLATLFVATSVTYMYLSEPNAFNCTLRINCATEADSWYRKPFKSPLGHNVLPEYFRYTLLAVLWSVVLVVTAYEKFIVLNLEK